MQPPLTRPQSATARTILADPRHTLQRMDVFLTSHKGNVISDLIKWGTGSFFSHAAATFLVPDTDAGFEHAFVMEAFGRGVEVRNAEKYFSHPENYDFAIVRLKAPWIGGSDEQADEHRKYARGKMLEHIEATYDRGRFLQIAWDVLFRQPAYLWKSFRANASRKRNIPYLRTGKPPRQFVCSTFVSYAFYEAAVRLEGQERAQGKYVPDTLFHPALEHGIPPGMTPQQVKDLVLSTAPSDLVRSNHFEWRWMVVKGVPRKVASREEALAYVREVYGPKTNF